MFDIHVRDGDCFPAVDRVPARISAWIECPSCGTTERRTVPASLPIQSVEQSVGLPQSIATPCDRCDEKDATMYLLWDVVLH